MFPDRLKQITLYMISLLITFPGVLISSNLNDEFPAHSQLVFSYGGFPCSECHEDLESDDFLWRRQTVTVPVFIEKGSYDKNIDRGLTTEIKI